jgi:hypothetical protein
MRPPFNAGLGLKWIFVKNTLMTGCGFRMSLSVNCAIALKEALPAKKAALAEHCSQTSRQGRDPRWKTLSDISGGELLAFLLQDVEWYRRYRFRAAGKCTH